MIRRGYGCWRGKGISPAAAAAATLNTNWTAGHPVGPSQSMGDRWMHDQILPAHASGGKSASLHITY